MNDFRIKITQETLSILAPMWRFKIHGDCVKGERVYWDLEFPDMLWAASFAQSVAEDHGVIRVDIRENDMAQSLYSSIVLTLVVDRVGAW